MIRLAVIALLASLAPGTQAAPGTCRISGTAYDYTGHPLPLAVIRLIDRQTRQTAYRLTGAKAAFAFADLPADPSGRRYRLDVLSPATVVTGSHIPTRSVLGIAPAFACGAGQSVRADVRVEVR
ncbi:MAG: carboxypeptidase regulatory-like domain-containing protein [Xanthomonadaceae bacterium]|nr:carboxypeptidase regulatory-like domain-containing protein [Xanthomonadaceae bacterium]